VTFADIIDVVIDRFEGGSKYTDAPGDHGGATKFGVTRGFRARAIGRPVSKADIKNLTRDHAVDTYRIVLLEQARLGVIHDWRVLFAVFDFAVNAGEDDAIPALQRAIGVTPDGRIGPKTQAALNMADALLTATRVIADRQAFHIRRSYAPQQAQWLRGWMNRCTANLQIVTADDPRTFTKDIRRRNGV
jgi:lysozyme family protein